VYPVGTILLVERPSGGRILILRIKRKKAAMTVRPGAGIGPQRHPVCPPRAMSTRGRRMMKQSWHLPNRLAAAMLAVWLSTDCGTLAAAKSTVGASASAKTDQWQPPLTVENPFFAPTTPAAAAANPPADADHPAIAGGPVAADVPPIYRLPRVDGGVQPTDPWAGIPRRPLSAGTTSPAEETIEPGGGVTGSDDILPLSNSPPDDMLQEMESLWQQFAFDEPAYAFDAAAAFPYTPTAAELSRQLLPSVRKAFGLAQRGATYAAQAEFVQVLRRIAQAKDAELGTDEHSRCLAAGLRALDEADDFMPDGVELEAEMNVAVIASSHRTPVLAGRASAALPHEAIALYHQYAEVQLGRAAAGERAGAMVLYGLGKVHNRLALEADGDLKHERKAMTMFLASLASAPENHLAANEVGVLFSRGGHHAEAAEMFKRAIDLAPTGTSYHNLAVVEGKLGRFAQAAANGRYAEQLAARDRATGAVSRRNGIAWVTPGELARVADPAPGQTARRVPASPLAPAQMNGQLAGRIESAAAPPGSRPAPPKSAWQKTVALARSLPLPGKQPAGGSRPVHVAQPNLTTAPQWR
jgi:tetratricopeptide (TPR) repeat protein